MEGNLFDLTVIYIALSNLIIDVDELLEQEDQPVETLAKIKARAMELVDIYEEAIDKAEKAEDDKPISSPVWE